MHPAIVVCSGALNEGERPAIPGVQLTPKTSDLRDLWGALRSAVPEVNEMASTAEGDAERRGDLLARLNGLPK